MLAFIKAATIYLAKLKAKAIKKEELKLEKVAARTDIIQEDLDKAREMHYQIYLQMCQTANKRAKKKTFSNESARIKSAEKLKELNQL